MTISTGANEIPGQAGLDSLPQAGNHGEQTTFTNLLGDTPSSVQGRAASGHDESSPPRSQQELIEEKMPPSELVWGINKLPPAQLGALVERYVAEADSPLITGLYTNPEGGISAEGWAAVRENAGSAMSKALGIVGEFLETGYQTEETMGQTSLEDQFIGLYENLGIQVHYFQAVERLQEKLGLSRTPQGELTSIVLSSLSALAEGVAGAIADPVAGHAHLEQLHSGFESVANVMQNPTQVQLDKWYVGTTNVEIYNSDIVQGIVRNVVLDDLGVPRLPDGTFDETHLPTSAEVDAHQLATHPFFKIMRQGGFENEHLDPGDFMFEEVSGDFDFRREFVEPDSLSSFIGIDGGPGVGNADDGYDVPGETDPAFPDHDPSLIDEESDDPETEGAAPDEEVEYTEMADGETVVEDQTEDSDAPRSTDTGLAAAGLWQPISIDFDRLDESAFDLDDVFSRVVASVGNSGDPDTPSEFELMARFTIFLENLGMTLEDITLTEAREIGGVVSTLATGLFENMAKLDEAGLGGSAAYAASEIVMELLSTVFYAGEIAEKNPRVAANIMSEHVQPFAAGMGEAFRSAAESYAETGDMGDRVVHFMRDARDMARGVYNIVFDLNAAPADVDDSE